MDLMERRALLITKTNPDRSLDYIVTLSGHLPSSHMSGGGERQRIVLRYVPDKLVLQTHALGVYFEALAQTTWANPEDLAVTVLTDVNNEVITRWIEVAVNVPERIHHAIDTHGVVIEDRQPGWDNPALLRRLARIS